MVYERQEIEMNYRVACQTYAIKDTVISIPMISQISSRKIQSSGLKRKTPLNPQIQMHVSATGYNKNSGLLRWLLLACGCPPTSNLS